MSKLRPTDEIVANGSYGITYSKSPFDGVNKPKPDYIRVWHIMRGEERIGSFATRAERRRVMRDLKQAERVREWEAKGCPRD